MPTSHSPASNSPTATVKLPGSFCNWLTTTLSTLGSSPSLDAVRAALDAARRTEPRPGRSLTLDASAPVLEMLAALALDCFSLGRAATGASAHEAARVTRIRLARAHATMTGR